jgi:hypothetical protein
MSDEEPKVPPPLFPSLDRGPRSPDDSDLDPLQTLHGLWNLLRLVLAGSAIVVGLFMSSCGTFLAVSGFAQTPLGVGHGRRVDGHWRRAARGRDLHVAAAVVAAAGFMVVGSEKGRTHRASPAS